MYLPYICVGKLMMTHMELPACVEKLAGEKDSYRNLRFTQQDDFRLNGQYSEVVLLLVHEAHHYFNDLNTVPSLNENFSYKA